MIKRATIIAAVLLGLGCGASPTPRRTWAQSPTRPDPDNRYHQPALELQNALRERLPFVIRDEIWVTADADGTITFRRKHDGDDGVTTTTTLVFNATELDSEPVAIDRSPGDASVPVTYNLMVVCRDRKPCVEQTQMLNRTPQQTQLLNHGVFWMQDHADFGVVRGLLDDLVAAGR